MKVSVIIPTLNAERWISKQLDMLLSQTVEAEILVIDSGSTDRTVPIVAAHGDRVLLLQIPPDSFDHGGTRDYCFRRSAGDFVCFLTQDAIPVDEHCLENLLAVFSDSEIAAVFGRQIAYSDAPEYEKLTRQFNYPNQPRIWREADIPRYKIKAYFFSNVCAAYSGFDTPIISNEDMMMAAKLLHAGYALAYTPEAMVYHSHRYTLREELLRNIRIGYVMEKYRDRLTGASTSREGWHLLRFVGAMLVRDGHIGELTGFGIRAAIRLVGNRIGKCKGRRSNA